MQTLLETVSNYEVDIKIPKEEKLRITSRDLEILQFILEMKFGSVEDIHLKFFKITQTGFESKNDWCTYLRLRKLTNAGLLRSDNSVGARRVYVITEKGYFFLRNSNLAESVCKPLFKIDQRTFNHDYIINQVRVLLERSRGINSWRSERALSEDDEFRKILPKEFRPDGLYINQEGHRVAFEMEIAVKATARYEQKVKRFIQIMQRPEQLRLFDKAHFVCAKKSVMEKLVQKSQLFQSQFQIELLEDIK